VGWYLENAQKGILGYTINILGSLVGIGLYTLLCFLYMPPSIWLLIAGVLLTLFFWRLPRLRWTGAAVFVGLFGLATLGIGKGVVRWSPYQKITITPVRESNQIISYELNTNDDWHQQIFDLSPKFVEQHPRLFKDVSVEWNA